MFACFYTFSQTYESSSRKRTIFTITFFINLFHICVVSDQTSISAFMLYLILPFYSMSCICLRLVYVYITQNVTRMYQTICFRNLGFNDTLLYCSGKTTSLSNAGLITNQQICINYALYNFYPRHLSPAKWTYFYHRAGICFK